MWEEQLNAAIEAGVAAIEGILKIYNTDFDVEIKDDNSPVTLADKNADTLREKQKQAFTVCDLEKVSSSLTLRFLLWKTLE